MKGLGKGLDALLGGYEEPNETAVSTLSVYLIDNNSDQPRKKDSTKRSLSSLQTA